MLEVEGLSRRFGGVYAVRDVELRVQCGEVRGIIGPNGAGKSTLFHLIAGQLQPHAGRISLRNERVEHLRPDQRARLGIAIVYQAARIFRRMTVLENVMVGAHARTRHGFFEAALRLPSARREDKQTRSKAESLLDQVGLAAHGHAPAESLPIGQQRAMQLARALASDPQVLLLDEPASGLREAERSELARVIEGLRERGLTVLLVEHDVAFVTRLSDQVTVLDLGRVIAQGSPDAIRKDPAVISAYLGAEAES
jgi:branched-chain amino acid transport system ATP-binding protein